MIPSLFLSRFFAARKQLYNESQPDYIYGIGRKRLQRGLCKLSEIKQNPKGPCFFRAVRVVRGKPGSEMLSRHDFNLTYFT